MRSVWAASSRAVLVLPDEAVSRSTPNSLENTENTILFTHIEFPLRANLVFSRKFVIFEKGAYLFGYHRDRALLRIVLPAI